MHAHFVTFFSPGTLFAESTMKPIESWDIGKARKLAETVTERYGAIPYAFQFTTRSRGPEELDSSVSAKSPLYFLGGRVETLDEVKARATKDDAILVSNMEINGYKRIITTTRGCRWSQPLRDEDVVLPDEVGA